MATFQSIPDPRKKKPTLPPLDMSRFGPAQPVGDGTGVAVSKADAAPNAAQTIPGPLGDDIAHANEGGRTKPTNDAGQAAAPTSASISDLEQAHVRQSLDPKAADTTDEEALVNQQILDKMGGDLNDQRARMGRAGFGASGALAGMEGDTMRKAHQDASSSIYDIREREQNQANQQANAAMGLDIQGQDAAARRAAEEAQIAAINAMLGVKTPPPAADGGGGNVGAAIGSATGIDSGTSPFGKGTDQTQTATGATHNAATTAAQKTSPTPPPNGRLLRTDSDGTRHYQTPDGTEWTVPPASTP